MIKLETIGLEIIELEMKKLEIIVNPNIDDSSTVVKMKNLRVNVYDVFNTDIQQNKYNCINYYHISSVSNYFKKLMNKTKNYFIVQILQI